MRKSIEGKAKVSKVGALVARVVEVILCSELVDPGMVYWSLTKHTVAILMRHNRRSQTIPIQVDAFRDGTVGLCTMPRVFEHVVETTAFLERLNSLLRHEIMVQENSYMLITGTEAFTPVTFAFCFPSLLTMASDLEEFLAYFATSPDLRADLELAVHSFLAFGAAREAGVAAAVDKTAIALAGERA